MKVIRDSKIYVQAKDVAMLAKANLDIPGHILKEIFRDADYTPGSRTKSLDRFLCFDSIAAISFFKAQDWIVDYDKVDKLSPSECIELLRLNLERKRELLTAIENVRTEETRKKLIDRSVLIDHKDKQLKDIVCLKVGEQPLPYPEDLETKKTIGEKLSGFIKRKGKK